MGEIWFKLVGTGDLKEPCEKTESNLNPSGSQSLIPQRIYDLIDDVIFLHLGQKRKPGIFTLGDLCLTACCLQPQNLEVFDFGGLHKYLVWGKNTGLKLFIAPK